jgi:hypothetical protein
MISLPPLWKLPKQGPYAESWPDERKRVYLLVVGLRDVVIILLGLLEDYLGWERSIQPRRRRIHVQAEQTFEGQVTGIG